MQRELDRYVKPDREELTMAIDRQDSPYRRGNRYDRLPIPMVRSTASPSTRARCSW